LRKAIDEYARRAHLVRTIHYHDADRMRRIVEQHRAIIAALRGSSTEAYVRSVQEHFPSSPREYRKYFERKYGRPDAAAAGQPEPASAT
jgi:DNA-binding GntR family transcriptional regulator